MNLFKVIKTRLQLQGEFNSNSASKKPYKNAFSAFNLVLRNEGIYGLQKGLVPAYFYQILLNGCRFGMYDSLSKELHSLSGSKNSLALKISSGAISGIIGSFIATPFFLVKTRMQAFTKGNSISVGYQHSYVEKGTFQALKTIFIQDGIRGWWYFNFYIYC